MKKTFSDASKRNDQVRLRNKIRSLISQKGDTAAPSVRQLAGMMDMEAAGGWLLQLCAVQHAPACTQALIDHGISIEATDGMEGHTALTFAAKRGATEVARVLIAAGANRGARTSAGQDALYLAVLHSNEETFELLLATGMDIRTTDGNGNGLLHAAAMRNAPGILKRLTATRELNVNSTNNDGCTPLHIASKKRRYKVVEALLEAGAVPSLTTLAGQSAYDLCPDPALCQFMREKDDLRIEYIENCGQRPVPFTPLPRLIVKRTAPKPGTEGL